MALYTVNISSAGSSDVVSLTDGSTYATLEVSAGRGPKGDGWTGVTYDNGTGRFTFTSTDGLGYVSDSITGDLDTAVTEAEAAQAAAEAAQAATENIFDQFGDQYLGPKASDPTVDNDGDPLTEGDIYFNTTDDVLKFYSGTAWVAPESIATTAANEAEASATAAATSETNAASSASAASTSETNAASSASAASTSETNAATSETNAASSASAASTSETNAAASETAAAASETAAAASETAAATSESNAASSASAASTSASNAATSETNAASSASAASTSETNAANSASAAASSYDSFDDRYLGAKASAPTVDNDGDPLITGALYFDTTSDAMQVYTGSAWVAAYVNGADYLALSGGTMTGDVAYGDNVKATFGAGSDLQIYHDGSNSYIDDTGAGELRIASSYLRLESHLGETTATFASNGPAVLRYDNAVKMQTTATGIDVTGTVTADGLTVDGNILDNAGFKVKGYYSNNAADGYNVNLGVTGNTGYLQSLNGLSLNTLSLDADTLAVRTGSSYRNRLNIGSGGDISFYEDTGTTPKFFWDASTERLGIGTSSPAGALDVFTGSDERIIFSTLGADAFINSVNGANTAYQPLQINGSDVRLLSGGTERMRIDASGNVGIGTSGPASQLHIDGQTNGTMRVDTTASGYLDLSMYENGGFVATSAAQPLRLGTNNTERLRIDSSGNVGIGTSNATPSNGEGLCLGSGSTITRLDMRNTTTGDATGDGTSLQLNGNNFTIENREAGYVAISTSLAERMRIDSSGNVGIGTSSPAHDLQIGSGTNSATLGLKGSTVGPIKPKLTFEAQDGSDRYIWEYTPSGNPDSDLLSLSTNNNAHALTVLGSGNVGIGTSSPTRSLHVNNNGESFIRITSSDTGNAGIEFGDQSDSVQGAIYQNSTDNSLRFNGYNNSEAMRIDSSGNLLVGKTSADNTTDGATLWNDGTMSFTANLTNPVAGRVAVFNRRTANGAIVEFRKDGSTVGVIGAGGGSDMYHGSGDTGLKYYNVGDAIHPYNPSSLSNRDNAIDLGMSSIRFDDIYATNGTIQTSDRNEKQDIEALSEAEQRVAVACKGLLRKFRWKDAVAEKGDDARIHFGIIAQDLQDAFAAEGLDAGRYAMFISSTWADEETGEERTRMGVRYSELLAFIIAAI